MISVVMSVYNASGKIERSLASIRQQTWQDMEIIVIDDASQDQSSAALQEFARQDTRVTVLRNVVNQGLTASLIYGVGLAKGEWIARLDAGDYWAEDKLERQMEFLSQHPKVVVLGTQVEYLVEGKVSGKSWFGLSDAELRLKFFTREGIFSHPSILFRNFSNYRPAFRYSQDLDLYMRLSLLGEMACLPQSLTFVEVGNDGITMNKKHLQRQYQHWALKLYRQRLSQGKDWLDENPGQELPLRDTVLDRWLCKRAMRYYKQYVDRRTQGDSVLHWAPPLAASLGLYPPLAMDYAEKSWGLLRTKFKIRRPQE